LFEGYVMGLPFNWNGYRHNRTVANEKLF
jgi:hypothetical protein